jgi:hypothetical protein
MTGGEKNQPERQFLKNLAAKVFVSTGNKGIQQGTNEYDTSILLEINIYITRNKCKVYCTVYNKTHMHSMQQETNIYFQNG